MHIRSAAATFTVFLVVTACGNEESAQKPSFCEKPPDGLVAKILAGTDLTAVDAVVVAADDANQGAYIAISFTKPVGHRAEVGV